MANWSFSFHFSSVDPLSILLFFFLIALSAFFSGTEIALITISKHTVQTLVREKRWGAVSLKKIKSDADTLLITILLGNNLVNVAASALATVASISIVESLQLPPEYGIVFATAGVTVTLLIFGEVTPKAVCSRFSEQISLSVAPIYRVLIFIFRPTTFVLGFLVRGVARIFGDKKYIRKISHEEVEAFIDMSHEEGEVEDDEHRQIKNLLSLSETSAESVMTPRVNVEFVSLDMTIDEVCEFFMNSSHSRMPIYGQTTDDINFMITFRDAYRFQKEGKGDIQLSSLSLEKIMKVPLTQSLDDLFEKFQKSRKHLALVLDEHGGTAGIVTMEDVLEEVFGDIKDEKDQEAVFIRRKNQFTIEAVGAVSLDDILEEFNMEAEGLGIPNEYIGEPVSYVILSEKEEFPVIGSEVIFSGANGRLLLKVTRLNGMVIESVACLLS